MPSLAFSLTFLLASSSFSCPGLHVVQEWSVLRRGWLERSDGVRRSLKRLWSRQALYKLFVCGILENRAITLILAGLLTRHFGVRSKAGHCPEAFSLTIYELMAMVVLDELLCILLTIEEEIATAIDRWLGFTLVALASLEISPCRVLQVRLRHCGDQLILRDLRWQKPDQDLESFFGHSSHVGPQ